MSGRADEAKTLEERLRLIEDRFEIYNLIASHPPSADTGASNYTASVCSTAAPSSPDRPAEPRSRTAHQAPSTTVRSSRGSRILPGCLMCGSPATLRSRSPICKSSCRIVSVRCSMSRTMVRRAVSTCTAFRPIAGISSAPKRAGKLGAGPCVRWTAPDRPARS